MEYDSPTSLYHTYARYFSPRLQRFLSEDPLQFGGGDMNLFAYVANDPVNGADPFGLVDVPNVSPYGYAYGLEGPLTSSSQLSGFGIGVVGYGPNELTGFTPHSVLPGGVTVAGGGVGCANLGQGCRLSAQPGSPGIAGVKGIVIAQEEEHPLPFLQLEPIPEGGGGGGRPVEEGPPVNPGDLKTLSKARLRGIDPEEFKRANVGRTRGGKFNIAVAPNGDIYLVPAKPGSGPPVPTGYSIDELKQLFPE